MSCQIFRPGRLGLPRMGGGPLFLTGSASQSPGPFQLGPAVLQDFPPLWPAEGADGCLRLEPGGGLSDRGRRAANVPRFGAKQRPLWLQMSVTLLPVPPTSPTLRTGLPPVYPTHLEGDEAESAAAAVGAV